MNPISIVKLNVNQHVSTSILLQDIQWCCTQTDIVRFYQINFHHKKKLQKIDGLDRVVNFIIVIIANIT
jgi:hypothetical protein